MDGKKPIKVKEIINTPDYELAFSYVDKGIPLYYYALLMPRKVTTRAQVIEALSYGVQLYVRDLTLENKSATILSTL